MKKPKLEQLKKKPSLWWSSVFDCIRIVYPNGNSEAIFGSQDSWGNYTTTGSWKKEVLHRKDYEFLGFL